MTPEQAKALRAEFPRALIGILPKPYKKDSPKANCRECGGYHGLPSAHLDFVGHAAATDRLLQVDPEWTWEPFATDALGLPALDREGNLWIRLTIAGVTRPGVGDGVSMKEKIGDAIRNAAMRFGVALDLWAKEDLHVAERQRGTEANPAEEPQEAPVRSASTHRQPDPPLPAVRAAQARAWAAVSALYPDWTADERKAEVVKTLAAINTDPAKATVEDWDAAAEQLEAEKGAA